MFFLDDIGPGFEPGKNGIDVNPIIVISAVIVLIIIIIITAININKKGK